MTHAAGYCGCFKPRDFQMLAARERNWLRFLLYLARRRTLGARGFEGEIIAVMMRERNRWLSN